MQIIERGLIFDATNRPAHERINAFTSLCRMSNGTILCGFQSGPGKHDPASSARVCRSRDGGRTWTDLGSPFERSIGGVPGSLACGEMVEAEPGRLLLFTTWFDRSDPARPLFDAETQGILHSKQLWAESADEGQTWGPWHEVPTPGLAGCAATGPVLRWADGTLGLAFESFKEFDDPRPGTHAAWLALSRDGGRTFPQIKLVAQHPQHKLYYWDQRLCEGRQPGEYEALFWTHHLTEQRDLLVHYTAGSIHAADTNRKHPVETTIPGQIAAPLLLPDGRLLAFVVDRDRPGTMKLWSSRDHGVTWPAADCLTVHTHDERAALTQGQTNVDFNEYWDDMAKWTFGHPALRLLDDGCLLLAWYAGPPGTLSIHWARVDTEAA
jgi:hypothetical protein